MVVLNIMNEERRRLAWIFGGIFFAGLVTIGDVTTCSQCDSHNEGLFVNQSGDNMTGNLNMSSNNITSVGFLQATNISTIELHVLNITLENQTFTNFLEVDTITLDDDTVSSTGNLILDPTNDVLIQGTALNWDGSDGTITADGGDISFGNENLLTTGWIATGGTPGAVGEVRLSVQSGGANSNPAIELENDVYAYLIQVVGARNDNFEIADIRAGGFPTRFTIDTSGNIGMGTTSPQERLDIANAGKLTIHSLGNDKSVDISHDDTDGVIETTSGDLNIKPAASTTLGDGGTTNYANFATDGELTLVGTARVIKEIVIPMEAVFPGPVAPTATIIGNFVVRQFSQAVTQSVFAVFHVPKDWASGTNILIHVHWAPINGNAGDVVWDIDYKSIASDNNEVLSGAGTALTVTDSTQTLQDELLESSDMTISGAGLALEDTIGITVSRDTGDAADTYASAASLVLVEIKYTADKLGTGT